MSGNFLGSPSILPPEYQEVEYLESTGEQWIDSRYIPNANTKIIFDTKMTYNASQNIRQGRYGRSQRLSIRVSAGITEWAIGNYTQINIEMYNKRGLFELDVPNLQGKLDNVVMTTFSASTWTNQESLYFFARHYNDTADGLGGQTTIYNVKIYENNTLIRDFIPCYRKFDKKPGLYDLINSVFYTNANTLATQDFIVGPDIIRFNINKAKPYLLIPNPNYVEGGPMEQYILQKVKINLLLEDPNDAGSFNKQPVITDLLMGE